MRNLLSDTALIFCQKIFFVTFFGYQTIIVCAHTALHKKIQNWSRWAYERQKMTSSSWILINIQLLIIHINRIWDFFSVQLTAMAIYCMFRFNYNFMFTFCVRNWISRFICITGKQQYASDDVIAALVMKLMMKFS